MAENMRHTNTFTSAKQGQCQIILLFSVNQHNKNSRWQIFTVFVNVYIENNLTFIIKRSFLRTRRSAQILIEY